MTLVAILGAESRSVTHRDWKTLLRNSANNMLTRLPYDVPQANFADNPVGFRCTLASMGKLVRLKDFFMPLEPPDQLHLQGADGFKEW